MEQCLLWHSSWLFQGSTSLPYLSVLSTSCTNNFSESLGQRSKVLQKIEELRMTMISVSVPDESCGLTMICVEEELLPFGLMLSTEQLPSQGCESVPSELSLQECLTLSVIMWDKVMLNQLLLDVKFSINWPFTSPSCLKPMNFEHCSHEGSTALLLFLVQW